MAVIGLPVGGLAAVGGWLAWHGRLSIGSASSDIAPSPKFGGFKKRSTKRAKKVNPWRAAPSPIVQNLCRAKIETAEGVRYILRQLEAEGVPGLASTDEARMSVVFVPKIASFLVGDETSGMTGAMVVSGQSGVLFLKGLPDIAGWAIYHEAIHFNQFVGTDKMQQARVDSLWKLDAKKAFPERAVWEAWQSVSLLTGWQNSPELIREVNDSIRKAWQKENQRRSPLVLTRSTLYRVLGEPRYKELRERLTLISQVRRGIAGDEGELTWAQELNRLLVFETEASAMAAWCQNIPRETVKVKPSVVWARRSDRRASNSIVPVQERASINTSKP